MELSQPNPSEIEISTCLKHQCNRTIDQIETWSCLPFVETCSSWPEPVSKHATKATIPPHLGDSLRSKFYLSHQFSWMNVHL